MAEEAEPEDDVDLDMNGDLVMADIDNEFIHGFHYLPLSLLDSSQSEFRSESAPTDNREDRFVPALNEESVEFGASSSELLETRLSEDKSVDDSEDTGRLSVDEVYFPSLDKYSGDFNFSVKIPQDSKKRPTFSSSLNTFFVQSQTNFTVQFSVSDQSPHMKVRAIVCYHDPAVLAEQGPILPCSCKAHVSTRRPEYDNRFLISSCKKSVYCEKGGHQIVSIKLSDMQVIDGKYAAVYSYASYTSCVAKSSRVATVFNLLTESDEVVGCDMFFCNVCACPPRDILKSEERLHLTSPPTRRRKRKHTHQSPEPDVAIVPDADGYYLFQWRTKSLATFNFLCSLKKAYSELQSNQ